MHYEFSAQLSSLTWQEISQISASGKASECFSIGDTKALTKPSGTNAIFVHNRGAGRMVFCTSKTVLSVEKSRSQGITWFNNVSADVQIKEVVDDQYQNIFDDEVISSAKTVTVNTATALVGSKWTPATEDSTQKFYPPSATEVGGAKKLSHNLVEETVPFSYFSSDAARKSIEVSSGDRWGTRSNYFSLVYDGSLPDRNLLTVDSEGKIYSTSTAAKLTIGIPLCFEV